MAELRIAFVSLKMFGLRIQEYKSDAAGCSRFRGTLYESGNERKSKISATRPDWADVSAEIPGHPILFSTAMYSLPALSYTSGFFVLHMHSSPLTARI